MVNSKKRKESNSPEAARKRIQLSSIACLMMPNLLSQMYSAKTKKSGAVGVEASDRVDIKKAK